MEENEALHKRLEEMKRDIEAQMIDLDPEFQRFITENFWDLVNSDKEDKGC